MLFPRKENPRTHFITRISLWCDTEETIFYRTKPHEGCSEEEIGRLRGFARILQDFDKLRSLVDEATEAMGLGS